MPDIGKTAKLQVIKELDFGLYLDGQDLGEILLPARYVPAEAKIDDWIDVFIYLDSEDIIIATTEVPYAEAGECAYLKVVDVNSNGAFLDWGLSKDLFVPFREQRVPMHVGKSHVVYIFEDNSGRICASSKIDHFLSEQNKEQFQENQIVDLLIASRSPLGLKAIINETHLGLIHNNDILASLQVGVRITGYIKSIRTDDAIDLTLQPIAKVIRDDLPQRIMDDLEKNGGVSDLTDKSTPEAIFQRYQISKANYKKALGKLFKDNKILLGNDEITLVR